MPERVFVRTMHMRMTPGATVVVVGEEWEINSRAS